jgi:hypothetical protein
MNGSEMPAGGLAKLETMEKRLQAVYKHGALYPLEPLQTAGHAGGHFDNHRHFCD